MHTKVTGARSPLLPHHPSWHPRHFLRLPKNKHWHLLHVRAPGPPSLIRLREVSTSSWAVATGCNALTVLRTPHGHWWPHLGVGDVFHPDLGLEERRSEALALWLPLSDSEHSKDTLLNYRERLG